MYQNLFVLVFHFLMCVWINLVKSVSKESNAEALVTDILIMIMICRCRCCPLFLQALLARAFVQAQLL